jgi:hypothetical protein
MSGFDDWSAAFLKYRLELHLVSEVMALVATLPAEQC